MGEGDEEELHIREMIIYQGNTLAPIAKNPINKEVLGVKVEPPDLSYLIDRLMECESGGNQHALNPVDLDGTPSNGLFQFKRSTWKFYIKKYNLFGWQNFNEADWENTLWVGDLQRIVVERMFVDPDVRLRSREFPDCAKRIGLRENYAN